MEVTHLSGNKTEEKGYIEQCIIYQQSDSKQMISTENYVKG